MNSLQRENNTMKKTLKNKKTPMKKKQKKATSASEPRVVKSLKSWLDIES